MSDSNTQDRKASRRGDGERKKRVSMGVPRSKLAAPKIPGYVTRWFNNRAGRLDLAKQSDWEHVTYSELNGQSIGETNVRPTTDQMGEDVSALVGTDERGSELRAYYMKLKQEWYDEDQKAKADFIDAREQGITILQGVDAAHQYGEENTRIGLRRST